LLASTFSNTPQSAVSELYYSFYSR
jgi:hypothetical protein